MEITPTPDLTDPPIAPDTPPEATGGFSSETAKRAARNATALALSTVTAKGLLFLWQLVLARWLGSGDYGLYGTIGALLAVGAAIPEFGMGLIVIRDVAARPQDAGRYLSAALAMQPALAGVGYVILTLAAFVLGQLSDDYDVHLRALLALAALSLLIDTLGNMCYNQLVAVERMVITAVISAAHIGVLVAFAGIALALDGGLWGLYVATLLAGILRSAALWTVLWRIGTRPVFPLDRAITRSLVINGAPIAITSFLSLAYQHTDKLLTTALIGKDATGQLTAGFVIVFGVIELLSSTVLIAVFPLMSRAYNSGMREMFEFMLEKLAFLNMTLSLPLAIYTSLLAAPLSEFLFGEGYTRTADILKILIWYTVVTMVANVFVRALLVQNRQRRNLAIRTGGLSLNILLLVLLLPHIGVQGAAVASLIAEIVVLVLIIRSLTFPPDWWQRVISHTWRLAVAASGLAAVVFVTREIHPILAAVTGVPVYIGLVLVSGAIASDDWDLIYRLAMAMPGGSVIGRYWKRKLA